jgi:hypothetical protein
MWDYYGNIVENENQADPDTGWRNDFFVMKSSGEWKYRSHPHYLVASEFWKSPTIRKKKEKFKYINGMKKYKCEDQHLWTNECDFIKRYSKRKPLFQNEILNKFFLKYETIFRWMLIAFDKRETFWNNIRRDFNEGKIVCYEIRLEEIVNSFTDVTRKYWKNQRGIGARSRRTELFKSDLFTNRKGQRCYGSECFSSHEGTFAKKVLYFVRETIVRRAGEQITGIDWEEALLYSMASNGDYFGTGMMRYNETQLYKKCLKVIELPPIARLNVELMFDIKFYARSRRCWEHTLMVLVGSNQPWLVVYYCL